MEKSTKVYYHYNHTDACCLSRWTARECYHYLYARSWQKVVDFYEQLVSSGKGSSSLYSLFPSENHRSDDTVDHFHSDDCDISTEVTEPVKARTGRWERKTFKIVLSYHGGSFDGWQKQPGLHTVQGVVEQCLGRFVDEKKAKQLKEKSMPVEACTAVAGRTDKGVTALQQVCSFYTWRKDVSSRDIIHSINGVAPGKIRALDVTGVSRVFHPNFVATWRRYFYILPLNDNEEIVTSCFERHWSNSSIGCKDDQMNELQENHPVEKEQQLTFSHLNEDGHPGISELKPRSFSISKVDQLLQQLEGKSLSYKMFARDTKASRSSGPATECFMFHARAAETKMRYNLEDYENCQRAMCVELVANRFLRKMVRVIVATAIREAAAGADDDALIKLMDATCRRATAPPAPPEGLCLVNVGYGEFKEKFCLIR